MHRPIAIAYGWQCRVFIVVNHRYHIPASRIIYVRLRPLTCLWSSSLYCPAMSCLDKLILFVNFFCLCGLFSLLFWLWHRIRSKLTVILGYAEIRYLYCSIGRDNKLRSFGPWLWFDDIEQGQTSVISHHFTLGYFLTNIILLARVSLCPLFLSTFMLCSYRLHQSSFTRCITLLFTPSAAYIHSYAYRP